MTLPPFIPLLASIVFTGWLFRKDADEEPVGSRSLWISGIWLFLLSSRSVGAWLFALFGSGSRGSGLEGNLSDVIVLSFLIISCIGILNRRNFQWGTFIGSNTAIVLLYTYFLASAFWSDYPFVAFKRVIKDFGLVFLVLVIATEANWKMAIRKLFLRVAYVIFPLSVVLIKWFPSIGRTASSGGESMMGGVTVHKNSLGLVLMVFGLILVWDLLELRQSKRLRFTDSRIVRRLMLLFIGGWLLFTANSKTALVCLVLGLCLLWFTRRLSRARSPKAVFAAGIVAVVSIFTLDAAFHIRDGIVESLGRDSTLTGRTRIWDIVRSQQTDPLVGCGFMMFWDSKFGSRANDQIGARLNSAHNGYLDVYLDGGIIGVCVLALMLTTGGIGIICRLFENQLSASLGFIFFCISLIYNYSESSFFRLNLLWAMLLMAMIAVPKENQPLIEPVVGHK